MDKEPSLCSGYRGSLTVESAVVMPFVTIFLVCILFWFRVMSVQTQVQQALCYAGRSTACAVTTLDTSGKQLAYAKLRFAEALMKEEDLSDYILGGYSGISLLTSDFTEEYICLKANYQIPYPFEILFGWGVNVCQESKSRRWVGQKIAADVSESGYVYVTENGTVYHISPKCKYLDLSIQEAEYAAVKHLKNKSGQKYKACSECAAKKPSNKMVYITDYGTCYHAQITCSGLKRTVYKIHLSEAGNKKKCSKCGK